jgi:hypothetical protein
VSGCAESGKGESASGVDVEAARRAVLVIEIGLRARKDPAPDLGQSLLHPLRIPMKRKILRRKILRKLFLILPLLSQKNWTRYQMLEASQRFSLTKTKYTSLPIAT